MGLEMPKHIANFVGVVTVAEDQEESGTEEL